MLHFLSSHGISLFFFNHGRGLSIEQANICGTWCVCFALRRHSKGDVQALSIEKAYLVIKLRVLSEMGTYSTFSECQTNAFGEKCYCELRARILCTSHDTGYVVGAPGRLPYRQLRAGSQELSPVRDH